MVQKLREITLRPTQSVGLLGESVNHLSQSAAGQSESLVQQSTALQQTQSTVAEISHNSDLAAKTQAVLQQSQRVEQLGLSGGPPWRRA